MEQTYRMHTNYSRETSPDVRTGTMVLQVDYAHVGRGTYLSNVYSLSALK